jgi:hypothetical protein
MSVVIRFSRGYAAFSEGRWTGTDRAIQQALNAALRREPVPAFHPDPDAYALELAKERLPSLDVVQLEPAERERAPSLWGRLRSFLFG